MGVSFDKDEQNALATYPLPTYPIFSNVCIDKNEQNALATHQ